MPSKPSSSAPSPISRPGFSWEKIDALWAQHGVPVHPKVVMRTDPKTGKTVFTNTELVPELAPQPEETHWATSASSVPSVTQPPGSATQPPDHSSTKSANCGTSSLFCDTPELPQAPVFSGDDADSCEARPHYISSPEETSAQSGNGCALEVRDDDPPERRLKKLALKIFQNGGSYKTVAGNLGISRDKARTWKRLWQIGRFEDNIRGIRFSGDYAEEIKAKVRERLQRGATPGELEKEFKIPRQTIRKWR